MKVSVILPVYNVERYIAKCIESILNQSYTNFELLIINDGSPDESISVVKQKFNDKRIKIFDKENGGLSDARNYGLKRASGELIYFIDSDDWIEPELLKECIDVFNNNKLELVVFGYFQDNEDKIGNVLSSIKHIPTFELLRKDDDNNELSSETLGLLGYAWNKVYRRSFLLSNQLEFEKGTSLVEDVLFNSQVFLRSEKIVFIRSAFYHYISRPVTTLMTQYYHDCYELKVKKSLFLDRFLKSWNISNANEILSDVLFNGLRSCLISLLCFENNLTFIDRETYVRDILKNRRTIELLPYYKPDNLKNYVFKVLIRFNLVKCMMFIVKLWSNKEN
ncbi:glycosyltransferase family 2 protein [Carboxylicivirga marina]|uniref:glycosyltransferase family 2 protein n=1 Tax=Carboxylicivirga marina TaxID=2800988 RepID=UPI00259ADDCF|nr:glycosyltransferase family 2 protein [uncultured Carboxylicivirga sp.]